MTVSASSGWIAVALIPLAAVTGWVLHRIGGRYALRMRPHYVIGYGAVALTGAHAWTSTGTMGGADARGIWIGVIALLAIVVQTFLGMSLQAPGAYRIPLRRWHGIVFFAVLPLAAVHVALNGPVGAMVTAVATAR